jgi:hypothetical protein
MAHFTPSLSTTCLLGISVKCCDSLDSFGVDMSYGILLNAHSKFRTSIDTHISQNECPHGNESGLRSTLKGPLHCGHTDSMYYKDGCTVVALDHCVRVSERAKDRKKEI